MVGDQKCSIYSSQFTTVFWSGVVAMLLSSSVFTRKFRNRWASVREKGSARDLTSHSVFYRHEEIDTRFEAGVRNNISVQGHLHVFNATNSEKA